MLSFSITWRYSSFIYSLSDTFETIADPGFLCVLHQLQSTESRWNLWRIVLDRNHKFVWKTFWDQPLRKKNIFSPRSQFFYKFSNIRPFSFHCSPHRILSRNIKFHPKICIPSRVITFWILSQFLLHFAAFWLLNRCMFLDEIWYLSMKFDIYRWNSI